jgi:hypothetical protein
MIDRLKGTSIDTFDRTSAGNGRPRGSTTGPASPQGAPQTLSLMKVDPQSVATGYRTSKMVGSTVVNEANETVGTIDDLIVTPNEKVPYAVLSVGGSWAWAGNTSRCPSVPSKCKTRRLYLLAPQKTR